MGISIDSLSAQTCDENWSPSFGQHDNKCSFKLLELQKLAVYWTEFDYDDMFSKMNFADLAVSSFLVKKFLHSCFIFQHAMSSKQNNNYSLHYILSPVCAQAHIRRNCCEHPLRSSENPRIWCDLQLEEVPLILVDVRSKMWFKFVLYYHILVAI